MMRNNKGLTLIEVLVAFVILVVGIFALVQLQATSLRSTALAKAINETTRFVRGELDRQKQTTLDLTEVDGEPCLEPGESLPDGIASCTLTVEPCHLSGSSLVCGGSHVIPSAFRISVEAVGPMEQELRLSALWTGKFIAGAAGEIKIETTP